MSAHDEPGISVGAVLDQRYELRRVVGEGGMGTVFEAFDQVLERRVAVKFLRASLANHADLVARFELEAKIASAFQHANVATTFDVGRHESGARYLVMEFLEGASLAHAISRALPLDERAAVAIVEPIARALAKAHQAGVIHRDVKPENIFLVAGESPGECVPKLVDFGIAKRDQDASHRLTATSTILGTPAYMPPEQARGASEITGAVDQYALGVVLYELLSAAHPHAAPSVQALLARKLTEPPVELRSVAPNVTPELAAVVMRSIASDPAQRFADMNAMRDALARAVGTIDPPRFPQGFSASSPSSDGVDSGAQTLAATPDSAPNVLRSTPATRASTAVFAEDQPAAIAAPAVTPVAIAPPVRSQRATVWAAFAAGLAAALVAVAAVRVSRRPRIAIQSSPMRVDVDAAPTLATLEVRVEPRIATVLVDGVERGQGEARVTVASGAEVEVEFRAAGFASRSERRRVLTNERAEYALERLPVAPTIAPTVAVATDASAPHRPAATHHHSTRRPLQLGRTGFVLDTEIHR